jgi:hypothetical protein
MLAAGNNKWRGQRGQRKPSNKSTLICDRFLSSLRRRLWNRIQVILRHSIFPNHDVTFDALKIGVLASLIELVIQSAIQVRLNVTTAASPA